MEIKKLGVERGSNREVFSRRKEKRYEESFEGDKVENFDKSLNPEKFIPQLLNMVGNHGNKFLSRNL